MEIKLITLGAVNSKNEVVYTQYLIYVTSKFGWTALHA